MSPPREVEAYVRHLKARVSEAQRTGQLGTTYRSRHVPHALDARYEDGFHATSYRYDVVHEVFPDDTLPAFLTALRAEPEYLRLAHALPFPVDPAEAPGWLAWREEQLLRHLLRGHGTAEDHIAALAADLASGPLDVTAEVWLTGVHLPEEPVMLSPCLTLRRFTAADVRRDPRFDLFSQPPVPHAYPSAVLVAHGAFEMPRGLGREVRRAVQTLSLAGVGTVQDVATLPRVTSLDPLLSAQTHTHTPWPTTLRYTFDEAARARYHRLSRVLSQVAPPVPDDSLARRDWTGFPDIDTAYERYTLALHEERVDARVARLVEALESLFGEKAPEVKRRVCQRAALLLGMDEVKALDAFALLSRCYDHRSTYAHGGVLTGKDLNSARATAPDLAELVRRLIVLVLTLRRSQPDRAAGNRLLDAAMLDLAARAEVLKFVSAGEDLAG